MVHGKKKRAAKASYIENGDFATGALPPWKLVKGPIVVVPDSGGNYARFGADAKLSQHWIMPPTSGRHTFSLDIRVVGGENQADGNVQVILLFQAGSGAPVFATYNIKESSEWEYLTLPFNLREGTNAGTVELVVQPGFTKEVSMRNISVTNEVVGGVVGFIEVL